MSRVSTIIVLVLVIGLPLAAAGCTDELKAKEAHIALIEDTNLRLTEDLAALRLEVEECALQRDDLDVRVLAFQGEVGGLRAKLAEIPERPTPAVGQLAAGGAMIATLDGSVLFAAGKPTLRAEGRSSLESIVSAIRNEYATKDILVFGHTDDAPIKNSGWKDNFELSVQRALSVVRFLRDRGIDPERLAACGAGEHRPRVANTSKANRAKNRRVEIYAVEPMGR